MPKRAVRRTGGSEEGREDGEPPRKRHRKFDVGELCQELYDTLRNFKTDDGRVLCETFIRAPKRRSYADYYEVVSTPMDLLKIQQKLKMEEYTDIEHLTADVLLMVNNAKTYYKRTSQEYKDACEIWELYTDAKNDLISESAFDIKKEDDYREHGLIDRNQDCGDEDSPYEELFTAVMTAQDAESRSLSAMFQLLPSKTRYPEYYRVIKDPIDLKMIATNIQKNLYQCLSDMEKDLLLMVKNAKTFNEPGSQIYRDASALRKIILNKKAEIDQRKLLPAKSSERIRAKRLAMGQKWSAITAALQYESDLEEHGTNVTGSASFAVELEDTGECGDDDDSGPEDADSNPQWQLYETVKNYQSPQGYQLSDPFLRLPSRRLYPDYYKEIKQPISVYKIRSKIKAGLYNSPVEVVDDMNLMFENAKKYNRPDSKIFKDAVKLQKIMQSKARELINLHMKDSDSDGDDEQTSKRKAKKSFVNAPIPDIKKQKRNHESESLKKRMKILYKTLVDYSDEIGRPLITMFMEKPSKKDYPDYYEVIATPIDMRTIESNIRSDKYQNEESLVADFSLMFNNCRLYNEEGSQIYRDADTLERALMNKIRDLGPFYDPARGGKPMTKRTVMEVAGHELYVEKRGKSPAPLSQKLRTLYDTIKDYTDNKNRKLSNIFMKLPSKADALTLQRIALQTKVQLSEDSEDSVPDVKALVQELLTSLFISVYNHQDEEGRCYSDSLVELAEVTNNLDPQNPLMRPLSLDLIKRHLDRGQYKRLDIFQEDVFEVFERARRVSRTDSQVFEDSVELQSFFIKTRDELCRNGEILLSPALRYTEGDLQASVDSLKAEKLPKEQQEAEMEPPQDKEEEKHGDEMSSSDSVVFKGQTYRVGDFVYIEPREKGMEPHIIHIEKLWRDYQGEQWIYGCWFYRPNETFHLATRKFLQKEVFKSDNYNSTPLVQVLGKCLVMFVKDYLKYKTLEFEDTDLFVCESRYSAKAKAFKKIKIWGFMPSSDVTLISREEPFTPVRVPSVFKNGVEKPKDEVMDYDEGDTKLIDRLRPNIILDTPNGEDATMTYFEQFSIPAGTLKLGDCCYVRTEHRTLIGRIDKMWVDKDGNPFFHGPWFVTPQEVHHPPNRLFFRQEVFLSSIEDTNPLLSVISRCAVLDYKDYTTRRPTEVQEQDIFICESRYLEAERQIRKLPKGLKKFIFSSLEVTDDECYFFRKPFNPQKELSPLISRAPSEADNEESNDQTLPLNSPEQSSVGTPVTSKKKNAKRLVTGYIIFASEVRKSVVAANPDRSFGEISRMIGTEWRNLPAATKSEYEERAQKQNEETAAKEALLESCPQSPASGHGENSRNSGCGGSTGSGGNSSGGNSTGTGNPDKNSENVVYECLWDGCDYQFEDYQDLIDHLLTEPNGQVHLSYQTAKEGEYQCLWQNCSRIKKNVPPFPNMQRLIRHCKEVHMKTTSKTILPDHRSKNFVPSRRTASMTGSNSGTRSNMGYPHTPGMRLGYPYGSASLRPSGMFSPTHSIYGDNSGTSGSLVKPAYPIFVSTPPKTQRVLHSNIYIKYIEGLTPENRHVSNWEGQLKATKENTAIPEPARLPTHWLANGAGSHGNVVNALWALRDFMLRDALQISNIV